MAKLIVMKHGGRVAELELHPEQQYIVGRGDDCAIKLEPAQGVSRQHFKVYFADGLWRLDVLSRYGEIYQAGQKISPQIILRDQEKLQTEPYEFVFEIDAVPKLTLMSNESSSENQSFASDESEKTNVGVIQLSPYLRVVNTSGSTTQLFKLEGQSWVVGRDTACPVFIDHPKMSRRHIEIRYQDGQYMARDLGSANGTMLNGKDMLAHQWTYISSGDALSVVDCVVYFELRDAQYEQKLTEIPMNLKSPAVYAPSNLLQTEASTSSEAAASVPAPWSQVAAPQVQSAKAEVKQKPNFVRIAIVLLLVGGVIYYFIGDDSSTKTAEKTAVKTDALSPFDKLKPEQQQYVRDSYRLADRLFKEGRYEMARQEIAKVHQLVPYFEDSKNLEKLAEVAIQTQVDQKRMEQQEKERQEMEEKIIKITSDCAKMLGHTTTEALNKKIEECLGPAIALNPEHVAISALKAKMDQLLNEEIARREKQSEYQSLVRKQNLLYSKAVEVEKQGNPLEAIKAYETVAASRLPDPNDYRGQSRRKIASIQQNLTEQQASQMRTAEDALHKNDYKTAILTLQKALKINPDNESVKSKINFAMNELRKQMQALYQEGILEESVGEVDSAKTKWKKIIDSSVPDEEYYKKSVIKLKKYGVLQ